MIIFRQITLSNTPYAQNATATFFAFTKFNIRLKKCIKPRCTAKSVYKKAIVEYCVFRALML